MKKAIRFLLAGIWMPVILTACGSAAEPTGAEAPEEEQAEALAPEQGGEPEEEYGEGVYVMRVGHAQTEESPRHLSLLLFKEQVEEQTDGNVIVEIYPNGELGDETEMTVAVSEGDLEAVRGGDLEFVPKTEMLGLPMIADTIEEARTLCYSDFVMNMLSTTETDYNMKVLAVGDDSGFRQITNNVQRITKPADLKGLKIRAPQIVATVSFFEEAGASATVVPFTELYGALESGSVDGQENPLALIVSSRFYEVQSHCTIIDYMFFPELMYVNLAWWDSLPEEYQRVLTTCARTMMDENARITDKENASYIQELRNNGVDVYTLTDEEREAFEPIAERVWEKYVDAGYITKDELDEMLAIIGKSVEW